MFEQPHMTLHEQLLQILTGESWVMDTDLADCEICSCEQAGYTTNGILIRTPDGAAYTLTIEHVL